MRVSTVLLACIVIVLSSCKKESSQNPGGGSGTGSGGATIAASNATTFYGIFTAYHVQSVSSGTLMPVFKYSTAYFSTNPTQYTSPATYTTVASVGMNGVQYKFQTYNYADTTYALSFPPSTWQVAGLGSIPSFTYTNTTAMPVYTAYSSLPDTVRIGPSLTVSTVGASGFSDITVSVSDANSHTTAGMLATGANSVTLSTSSLVATNNGTLVFSLTKNNVQSVNGKAMNFITTYQLSKAVVIN